jgi:hypothetical protein
MNFNLKEMIELYILEGNARRSITINNLSAGWW